MDFYKLRRMQKNVQPQKGEEGFTLLELLVVLGIIALLAALVAPQVLRYMSDARASAASAQLKNLQTAIELYFLDTGTYPANEAGVTALVKEPSDVPAWRGPYIKVESGLRDPWGKAYLYKFPGEHGAYDLLSLGRDGKPGGEGEDKDIQSW